MSVGSLCNMADILSLSQQTLLEQTAVLKLNGGLGTSMGLEKAKSLLPVKDGKTFLDLIAEQVVYTRKKFGSKVRFILMNRSATTLACPCTTHAPQSGFAHHQQQCRPEMRHHYCMVHIHLQKSQNKVTSS